MRLALADNQAPFYSLNGTDDSMLLVLTWHTLASLIVAIVGAVLGRGMLRW
ncbi:MAG: NrsF family protein [Bosea sp. (in: a-proteobacteria)]|uniref:NrsF family protein n=1 Tax=Bosea sp. (in: a-proteobacteria) TaxID=1871050 RepID=UPI00273693AE|nr:NrsF family protein [Bosea sp. (in: a-proteobacteria)]MDP3600065.1 NrsF family protein [Bosea sp. (in: a-proteobacteria)]